MKARILGLLAAALLAGPMAASAGFLIDTNNDNKFDGTFSFSNPPNCNPPDPPDPSSSICSQRIFSAGGLLPGSAGDGLFGARQLGGAGEKGIGFALLYTDEVGGVGGQGNEDDPAVIEFLSNSRQKFGDQDGSYNNSPYSNSHNGASVYWRFSNLSDTGGEAGTFAGAFCFSTIRGECTSGTAPEPGTLALLGLGLAGLAASRRRKR